jgi:polysaccharide chain length determinant protein (PEP-CTERM system associated)
VREGIVLPGKRYSPEEVLWIAWRHRWALVVPLVVASIGTALVAVRLPDRYRSETVILVVPQRVPESYVKSTVTSRLEDRLEASRQQILSRTRLERIVFDYNLYPQERRLLPMQDVIERMLRDIAVRTIRGDAFVVSYVSSDPRLAQKVTERVAAAFMDESLNDRANLAEATTSFLETQLVDARKRLEEHERKLADYKVRHMGELPTEREANLQMLGSLQMQVRDLAESMNRDRERRLGLERTINDLMETPTVAVTVTGDDPTNAANGATAQAQLEGARAQLRVMELRLKSEHPDVVRMRRVIRDLEAKVQAEALEKPVSDDGRLRALSRDDAAKQARLRDLKRELEAIDRQMADRQAEEKRLRASIAGYQQRVEATPARESELTSLMRDYATLQNNYASLLAKQEDSKISANLERRQIGEQFRTVDPARLPEKPFSPNRALINLGGAIAGLALGLALVAALEYRDNSLRTDDEVVRLLSLPVVALVPVMLSRQERARRRRGSLIATGALILVVLGGTAAVAWLYVARQ